jgi:hypothetical protein
MSFIATALIQLTNSAAKILLEDSFAPETLRKIAPDLMDLFASSAEHKWEESQRARRIDTVANRVALRLRQFLEAERANLDEDRWMALVVETASIFRAASIDEKTIIDLRLNPEALAHHLRRSRNVSGDRLSERESSILDLMLLAGSREIIEIFSALSEFDRTALATTLQGQDQILAGIDEILQAPSRQDSEFEVLYLRSVARSLDRLDLFGIPYADDIVRRQSLSSAAINPHLRLEPVSGSPAKRLLRKGRISRNSAVDSIDHLVKSNQRLVVTGEAGSGKSTLAQWIAVRCAGRLFSEDLSSLNRLVPFFVRLREISDSKFPAPEDFPRLTARQIAGEMPPGWVHRQLKSGKALVLLDGVDELPAQLRDWMLGELTTLVASYPLSRYLVTSRPSALHALAWPAWSEWRKRNDFVTASIEPMPIEKINILIEQWHSALDGGASQSGMDPGSSANNLKIIIRKRRPLRRLASNPLLCSMLCALHITRHNQLPSERIKLYQDCCEMLLSRRDAARKILLQGDYPNLGERQKLILAQSFAYWLMRNGYSDASIDEVDSYFDKKLELMDVPKGTRGTGVRKLLVERSGILREPVVDRIDFAHKTFQEFLAAQRVVEENDLGFLLNRAADDQWKETIILAAGCARPQESKRLLSDLIERSADDSLDKNVSRALRLLSVACLETCTELEPITRSKILSQAAHLIPPQNQEEAAMLAAAGDRLIPFLRFKEERTEREAAMCVRILALIGTDSSLESIAEYSRDHRQSTHEEIWRARDSFKHDVFDALVLSRVSSLHLSFLNSGKVLGYLTSISDLSIESGFRFEELVHLAGLQRLESLSLWNCLPTDSLDPLENLPCPLNMQSLSLGGGFERVRSLEPLKRFQNLRVLILSSFKSITDLSILTHLPLLEHLSFIGNSNITDLSSLAELTRLQSLYLDQCSAISDLSPVGRLIELRELELDSCPRISSLEALLRLRNLQSINIVGTEVRDLSPLLSLENLRTLRIGGWFVPDYSILDSMKNLEIETTEDDASREYIE